MDSRYRWVILSLAFLAFGISYMVRMAYPPLIPMMSVALNLTYSESGMLMSGFWIGYVMMQLPAGFISDKIGVRRVYSVALTLTGFTCMLTGFARTFIDCLAYRFANGLAAGCISAPGSATVMRWFQPKDRAIAVSLFQLSVSVGTVIATASSAVIASILGGWRWTFWIFGIPSLIAAILSLFFLKEGPGGDYESNPTGGGSDTRPDYGVVLKDLRVWLLCLTCLGGAIIFIGTLTWIPTYLVKIVGLTEVHAGTVSSLMLLLGSVGTPLSGYVADRILKRRSPMVLIPIITAGLGCILISLLNPKETYQAIVLFAFILLSSTMWWISPSLLSEWLPLNILGTASGLLSAMMSLGGVLGPSIFGLVLDLTGSFSTGWFILGLIALLLASPMLLLKLKRLITYLSIPSPEIQ
ncbi:MAG: MFS transporter [Candidatus Bathyarchaeia archaeon]